MARTKQEAHKHTSCKTLREQLSKDEAMARNQQMAHKDTSCKTLREQLSEEEAMARTEQMAHKLREQWLIKNVARTEPSASGGIKRPPRYKPGTMTLREIRRLGKPATGILIKQAAFRRIVREISQEFNAEMRFQAKALNALHEAAEAYLVIVMKDIDRRARLAKLFMVQVKNERLAKWLRGGEIH